MDFDSRSNRNDEQVYDEEYIKRDNPEVEEDVSEINQWTRSRKNEDVEGGAGTYSRSEGRSKSQKKKKIKKMDMSMVKLVFKVIVFVVVCFNISYIWNFMKNPIGNFMIYHTLFVIGRSACINFICVWLLFYKKSYMRFYLSLIALIGSIGYYFYINYLNHSFMGNNLITSILMIISVLLAINLKANYYFKSIVLLVIPAAGIYVSGNKFALVWALMWSAGLILLFRVSRFKSKSDKKEEREKRRNQKQTA